MQVLARPSITSRACLPFSMTVPPEILRLVTKARISFSEALVLRGISGRSSTRRSSSLRPLQQTVEHRIAGSALEDAIELPAQEACLLRARGALVVLQAPIEPPDHPPGDLDGVALLIVGGNKLMDEALGVDPAERVIAEAELAGVVGDDDGMSEQALGLDGSPQRRFAGRPHRVGRRSEIGDAERAQVLHPLLVRAERQRSMAGELVDDVARQISA